MILATIFNQGIETPVEIIDVIKNTSRGTLAVCRAMSGEPFLRWTHGGWAYYDTVNVPVVALRRVSIGVNPEDALTRAVYGLDMQAAAEAAK